MNMRSMRSMFIYLLIAVGVMAIFLTVFKEPFGGSSEIPISRMISLASENKLESIEISGDSLTAVGSDGSQYTSRKESGSSIVEQLEVAGVSSGAGGVDVSVRGTGGIGSFFGILINFLPLIFFWGHITLHDEAGTGQYQPNI